MSIVFNDLTNYKGLVQIYEDEIGASRGEVSGNADKLKRFTAACNLALDDFFTIAFNTGGTWQFDDTNHTEKYPFIRTNIVSGQRDYTFTVDGQSNLILDIYRVMIADSNGIYREIYPVDQVIPNNNNNDTTSFINGQNATGAPYRYSVESNGIFLDPVPNFNYTNGLKVFINREGSYFLYTDTSKKPGVPGLLHRYFALKPAMDYARQNRLVQYNALALEVDKFEKIIGETFAQRERGVIKRLTANRESTK